MQQLHEIRHFLQDRGYLQRTSGLAEQIVQDGQPLGLPTRADNFGGEVERKLNTINATEQEAVEAENMVRAELGLPLRHYYDSTLIINKEVSKKEKLIFCLFDDPNGRMLTDAEVKKIPELAKIKAHGDYPFVVNVSGKPTRLMCLLAHTLTDKKQKIDFAQLAKENVDLSRNSDAFGAADMLAAQNWALQNNVKLTTTTWGEIEHSKSGLLLKESSKTGVDCYQIR